MSLLCRDEENEALTAEERFRQAREAMRARDAADRAAQKAARREKKLARKERLRAGAAAEAGDDAGVQLRGAAPEAASSDGETLLSTAESVDRCCNFMWQLVGHAAQLGRMCSWPPAIIPTHEF